MAASPWDGDAPQGQALLENISFTLRLQNHLENEVRANMFFYVSPRQGE